MINHMKLLAALTFALNIGSISKSYAVVDRDGNAVKTEKKSDTNNDKPDIKVKCFDEFRDGDFRFLKEHGKISRDAEVQVNGKSTIRGVLFSYTNANFEDSDVYAFLKKQFNDVHYKGMLSPDSKGYSPNKCTYEFTFKVDLDYAIPVHY